MSRGGCEVCQMHFCQTKPIFRGVCVFVSQASVESYDVKCVILSIGFVCSRMASFARVTVGRGGGNIWVDEDGNLDAGAAGGDAHGTGGAAGREFPARANSRMAGQRPLAIDGRVHRRVPRVRSRRVRPPTLWT